MSNTRVVIVTGAGGVGKTSVAAGIAAAASRRTYRTLVLTVDPARRLADTLAAPGLGNAPVPVQGSDGLWAAMLDAAEAWEAMITRHTEPDVGRRLVVNPYFRAIADRFPAAQAYAAGEQLAEYLEAGAWELIVVDTPPAGGGIDFFRAPGAMGDLMSGKVLRWLTGAGLPGRRMLYKLTARPMLRVLDTVLGGPLLEDLAEFLLDLRTLYEGLQTRARSIETYLAGAATLVVTTAQPTPLIEARRFHRELPVTASPPAVVVFNRTLPGEWVDAAATDDGSLPPESTAALRTNFLAWSSEAKRQLRLRSEFGEETGMTVVTTPWLHDAPTTVSAVADMVESASEDLLDVLGLPEAAT